MPRKHWQLPSNYGYTGAIPVIHQGTVFAQTKDHTGTGKAVEKGPLVSIDLQTGAILDEHPPAPGYRAMSAIGDRLIINDEPHESPWIWYFDISNPKKIQLLEKWYFPDAANGYSDPTWPILHDNHAIFRQRDGFVSGDLRAQMLVPIARRRAVPNENLPSH